MQIPQKNKDFREILLQGKQTPALKNLQYTLVWIPFQNPNTILSFPQGKQEFPGKKPLPGRENFLLSRSGGDYPGFTVCASVQEVLERTKQMPRVFVIGGGSVYAQFMDVCDRAYVTKVHTEVPSDTWFPDLDVDPRWKLERVLQSGEEDGIPYEMCLYVRIEE